VVHVTVSYTGGDKGLLLNGCTSTASHFTENAENLVPYGPTIYDLQDRSISDFSMRKSKNWNRRQGDGRLGRKSHTAGWPDLKAHAIFQAIQTGENKRQQKEVYLKHILLGSFGINFIFFTTVFAIWRL
jgi:hypothetical protein